MTPAHTTVKAHGSRVDAIGPSCNRWEAQLFGGLVLAAFLLYGVGSELGDDPIGLALVTVNSVAVTVIGTIGFRLL